MLTIRLQRVGVLYVSTDGQVYPSLQEYHGQTRLALQTVVSRSFHRGESWKTRSLTGP